MSDSVYLYDGQIYGTFNENSVFIADLKRAYPTYTDDQLLDAAILQAQAKGASSVIVWDGTDIYFSGGVEHVLKGFGGINFNGSNIYMPDYDNGIILRIIPDSAETLEVPASDILATRTTNAALQGKVFQINNNTSGNDGMCLGDRAGSFTTVHYVTPTVVTTETGYYMTGELYLTPSSGTVTCYNVHEYPEITFVIENATVIARNSARMSRLISCERSNTHVRNLVLEGRGAVTSYHDGVMRFLSCAGIEIDHIYGTNPVIGSDTSGYAILLGSVTSAYVHEVYLGDDLSWGVVGCIHLTNTVFERCSLNRWDCHYAQYGINVVRDCVLNHLEYGLGRGELRIENCLFVEVRSQASTVDAIHLRADMPGVYDGNIIVTGCTFVSAQQPANLINIWSDYNYYQISASSKLTGSPKRVRILERCNLIDGCKSLFMIGSRFTSDQSRYNGIEYIVRDCTFNCSDVVLNAYDSGQMAAGLTIENCRAQGQLTNLVSNLVLRCSDTDFGSNAIQVQQNSKSIIATGCKASSVVAANSSSALLMTGCELSGAQDVTKFSAYALSGNIASDMASVNKHSN